MSKARRGRMCCRCACLGSPLCSQTLGGGGGTGFFAEGEGVGLCSSGSGVACVRVHEASERHAHAPAFPLHSLISRRAPQGSMGRISTRTSGWRRGRPAWGRGPHRGGCLAPVWVDGWYGWMGGVGGGVGGSTRHLSHCLQHHYLQSAGRGDEWSRFCSQRRSRCRR